MIRVSAESKSSQQTGIPYSYYSKPSTQSTFVRNQEIPCGHAKTLPTARRHGGVGKSPFVAIRKTRVYIGYIS